MQHRALRFWLFFPLLAAAFTLCATSTSGVITRNVSINGDVTTGAAPGANGPDWETNEVGNSSDGVQFFYTWDNTNLYVAWKGGNKNDQHFLFIDTDPANPATGGTGSTTGPDYGCQMPSLPFTANFFVNIEANYNEYRNHNGVWPDGTPGMITVSVSTTNNDIEAIIPWSFFTGGRPAYIYLLSYLNAPCNGGCGGNNGFIYGAVPSGAGNSAGCAGFPTFVNWYYAPITGGQAPTGNAGVLPVTLLSFGAEMEGQTVRLRWETATERDNDRFEVLRSANLRDWEMVASVPSRVTNSNQRQRYEAADGRPLPGFNYYRLRQVDLDGVETFSPIAQVQAGAEAARMLVFPNPVRDGWVQVSFAEAAGQEREDSWLRLFDAQGQCARTWAWEAGAAAALLDCTGLVPGVYELVSGADVIRLAIAR